MLTVSIGPDALPDCMRAPRFTEVATPAAGESLVVGHDGLVSSSESHAGAWVGLLETHRSLTRELDATLEAEHGVTMSALEALTRLRAAKGHSLRLSALATMCGLSLSRISRITDSLEARGLVERRTVDSDRRAVQAHLTDAGLELARRAQTTHVASVHRLFFERLSDREVALLAEIFSRFVPVPAVQETGRARSQALAGPTS